jgi:hypothetical protein
MKLNPLAVTLLAVAGLVSAGAAQANGKVFVGAKLALTDPDLSGFDSAYTAGVYGGYNFFGKDALYAADLAGGTFAVEGDVMLTLSKGDAGNAGKWDFTSLAVYGAYRFPLSDTFYLKGRAGLVRYDINTTQPTNQETGSDTKLAAGIGGGMKLGPGNLEANITTYESDVLNYDIGFHLSF